MYTLQRLTGAATLLALMVILLGGYTRLTNAGLSCPDWPHCYGYLAAPHTPTQLQQAAIHYPNTPVNTTKAWTEMTHRYAAGLEGILIVVIAMLVKKRQTRVLLITLLGIQILLGMLTVTKQLHPVIVLAHLIIGVTLLSLLWRIFLNTMPPSSLAQTTRLTPWIHIGCLIVALQMILGGWVSTHYAALACIDFPYCHSKLLPPLQWQAFNSDLITIHMFHRLGALLTTLYCTGLALVLCLHKTYRKMGVGLLLLLLLQVTLGVLNIVWLRPTGIALLHLAVAINLLLLLLAIPIKIREKTPCLQPT